MNTMKAMFGGGCFWGIEEEFRNVPGVLDTKVGYSGGDTENPTYKKVCSGMTGHAEVALVTYDPEKVSYEELLDTFWNIHDPTTLNLQGPDIGTQYRSVIFYFDDSQLEKATLSKDDLQQRSSREIVTQIKPAGKFWKAEEYHQRYRQKASFPGCCTA